MKRHRRSTEHGSCGGFRTQTTDISIKYPSVAHRVLLTAQLELYIYINIYGYSISLLSLKDLAYFEMCCLPPCDR